MKQISKIALHKSWNVYFLPFPAWLVFDGLFSSARSLPYCLSLYIILCG